MNDTTKSSGLTRRKTLQTLGATTALATAGLAAPAIIRRASAADPIRVGVISPLTGAWTVYGKAHSAASRWRSTRSTRTAACSAGRSRS